MQMQDLLSFDKDARICADGALVAEVLAARTGTQDYLGKEVDPEGKRFKADQLVKVYRSENEVFKNDSLATFAAAPVTVNHPTEAVDSKNWKIHGVGEINGDVARDGDRVRVPIIVRDADAVTKATTTHKQLSMGYATDLEFPSDGKHPDGTACDAYQTNLRINHIALVPAARGGPELRVVDERPNPKTNDGGGSMPHTLTIDGLQVPNVSDEAKACIEKLQGQLADATTVATDAQKGHDKAIAKKDAEIDDLKKKVLDDDALDTLVDEKTAVLADAKTICGDKLPDTKGKSVNDIRRIAVATKLGDDSVQDKSDDYVEARFDTLKDAAPDNKVVPISSVQPAHDTATIRDAVKAARNS